MWMESNNSDQHGSVEDGGCVWLGEELSGGNDGCRGSCT